MQPTPGQWEIREPEEGKPYYKIRGTQLGCCFKIANVLFVEDKNLIPELHEMRKNEALANARLIVNAKDLYSKVKQLTENSMAYSSAIEADHGFDLEVWMEEVMSIIEKIEGESE